MSKQLNDQPYIPDFLSSFGRRIGRPLGNAQKKLADHLLPELAITLKDDTPIDIATLFGRKATTHLEIGFGYGEHLAGRALANPDINFIGCEPFINGVGKLLEDIDQHNITNIRIYTDDTRLLLKHLPDHSLQQVYILFPDPWRKPRHYKRRIVNPETLDMLARLQPSRAGLLLATDHENYKAWMLEQMLAHPSYEWTAEQASDWNNEPEGWIKTRYQEKTAKQGRKPLFINCVKV